MDGNLIAIELQLPAVSLSIFAFSSYSGWKITYGWKPLEQT